MIRAYFYLAVSGVLWLSEGFLFSYYLQFAAWQVALMAVVYLALFGLASRVLIRAISSESADRGGIPPRRLISVAPMAVVIVGSFASLPIVLLVAALGNLF